MTEAIISIIGSVVVSFITAYFALRQQKAKDKVASVKVRAEATEIIKQAALDVAEQYKLQLLDERDRRSQAEIQRDECQNLVSLLTKQLVENGISPDTV